MLSIIDKMLKFAGGISYVHLKFLPDRAYINLKYYYCLNTFPDLKNPKTYNEKLQWLKLNYHNPEYCELVDKYTVRKYVADKIGEDYLIPLLGQWNNFNEIDFSTLPDSFVLKTTHDSGGVCICRDKSDFDKKKAENLLENSLKNNFYYSGREWPYKNVKGRIICEKYMEDTVTGELRDYKFFVFNGKVKMMFIASDRQVEGEETKFDYFDENFKHLDFTTTHPNADTLPEKPENFEKMKELAIALAGDMPHVRVDFYEVNGKIYFGELTFFHWSGFADFQPAEWNEKIGDWLELPEKIIR